MISNPDQLDIDEGLYTTLDPRNKEVLYRLFNIYADNLDHRSITKETFTQDELRKVLASKLEEQTRVFLNRYEELVDEGVRTDPAIEYIAEHYDVTDADLNVNNRYELLLVLYESGLVDQLDELLIRAKIRSYSATRRYVLDEELKLNQLDKKITRFHEEWNTEQEDPKVVLADLEFKSDQLVVLKLYQEVGPQYPDTFAFRLDGKSDIPVEPDLTQVEYQQLKTIRLQIEQRNSETILTFTKPFNRWKTTLDTFFETVFGVDEVFEQMYERKSEAAEEIEKELINSVEAQDDPIERTRGKLDELQDDARDRIDNLDLPDEHKNDLKNRISTIKISGSEILDDQSIETQEFRLIATLNGLFDSVDGIEQGFREMIKQSEEDNRAFVLTINDRPVQFSNGTWTGIGPGSMPDRDRRALELFFSNGNE